MARSSKVSSPKKNKSHKINESVVADLTPTSTTSGFSRASAAGGNQVVVLLVALAGIFALMAVVIFVAIGLNSDSDKAASEDRIRKNSPNVIQRIVNDLDESLDDTFN